MGKNGGNSWFSAVKRAFRSPVKDEEKRSSRRREENEQEEEKKRGKRRWIFLKPFPQETTIQHKVSRITSSPISSGENLVKKQTFDHNRVSEQRRAIAVAMASTAAAEAAVATAQAAVEIIHLTRSSLLVKEQRAAVVIQTAFRGYLARKALLALKGIVKLQALVRGHNVRKRAKMTLQCIQSLVRVQTRVCDQRRRLSCEGTSPGSIFNQAKSAESISMNASNTSNDLDDYPCTLEEIQELIQKAKKCSLKQILRLDDEQFSEGESIPSGKKTANQRVRNDRNLCNPKDSIKIVEIDTSQPYLFTAPNSHKSRDQSQQSNLRSHHILSPLHKTHQNFTTHSPITPSSSKIKSTQSHSASPRYYQIEEKNYQTSETPTLRSNNFHRMSASENSAPAPRPNFMSATASTMARVRSHSVPKLRYLSPNREQTGSVKKRLSFLDGHSSDDNTNTPRYKNIHSNQFSVGRISNVSSGTGNNNDNVSISEIKIIVKSGENHVHTF